MLGRGIVYDCVWWAKQNRVPQIPYWDRLIPCLYPIKDKDSIPAYHSRGFIGYVVLKIWRHASRLARWLPTKVEIKVESWGKHGSRMTSIWRIDEPQSVMSDVQATTGTVMVPTMGKSRVVSLILVTLFLIDYFTDSRCPICLVEYSTGEKCKQLPCKHDFHPACILPWLGQTNTCPVCRHELPTDDEDYEEFRREKVSIWQ